MTNFSAAQAMDAKKPRRTVKLPPSAFADGPQKPTEPRLVGIRLLGEGVLQAVRVAAVQAAQKAHKDLPTSDPVWVETFNAALMAGAAARALCHPDDVDQDYWPMQRSVAPAVLGAGGIERIWDELEQLKIETSPTSPEANEEDIAQLVTHLSKGPTAFAKVMPGDARALRRLLRHILDMLDAAEE